MQVLITDPFEPDFLTALAALPVQFNYLPEAPLAEILPVLAQAEIHIAKSRLKLNAQFFAAAPALKATIRAGSGAEHIDEAAAALRGIKVVTTPTGNPTAVAEHAIGMLLSLMNHLRRADAEVRQFSWQREANRGHEIGGRVVGIIGYGHTGSAFARKLSGFGAEVIAYDKYKTGYSDAYAREATMDELFARAEVLSLHVPLTPETHHLVDTAFLARFTHPIWLLNLARGPVVNTPDLLTALVAGRVRAAGLDVLENENFATLTEAERVQYNRLFALENVLLSPHIGGWSFESAARINALVLEAVQELL